MKKIYTLDGTTFSTLEEFAKQFSDIFLEDYCWTGNLDAFNDILRGGFGTPIGGFVIEWKNSNLSRRNLGYPETIKWIESHIQTCHPSNIPCFQAQLAEAIQGRGPTLFDTIVEIIREHGPDGSEQEDGVELWLR